MINYNSLYPQYSLPQQTPQVNIGGLKGRLVSSIDEAKVAQIDFDGSLFIFPDLANKKIYTKQVAMDGTAVLNSYALEKLPATNTTSSFVTKEEFEQVISELKAAMQPTPSKPAILADL